MIRPELWSQQTTTGELPSRAKLSRLACRPAMTRNPGAYTAIVRGVNNAIGVGLVEVYDLDGSNPAIRLTNISTRGNVQTNDNVMIGGFVIQGDTAKSVILRVLGPSLSVGGTPMVGRLMDPTLELHDGNGTLLAQNDNWQTTQASEIQATSLAPSDDRESAIVSTLVPGAYTAIVRGSGTTTGIALFELYDLDPPPTTLYIAQLRPVAGVASGGSGTVTLRMSADETSAIVAFDYSNLSSPVTGIGIYGDTGELLFDISASTPQPDGTYNWIFKPRGTYTVAAIIAAIQSGKISFIIQTSSHPAGELSGSFNLSSGGQSAPTPTPPPSLASGTPAPADAGRFLSQSTFGTSDELITKVQNEGFNAFLASGTPSPADAGRFLSQSTFGTSDELITYVQNEGFNAFLASGTPSPADAGRFLSQSTFGTSDELI